MNKDFSKLFSVSETEKTDKPGISVIRVNHDDTAIVGKYDTRSIIVKIIADSYLNSFSIELPPQGNTQSLFFIFNVPSSGDGNTVSVLSDNINNSTSILVQPFGGAIVTDGLGNYVSMNVGV